MSTPVPPVAGDGTPADGQPPAGQAGPRVPGPPSDHAAAVHPSGAPEDTETTRSGAPAPAPTEHVVAAPALTVPPLSVPSGSGGEVPAPPPDDQPVDAVPTGTANEGEAEPPPADQPAPRAGRAWPAPVAAGLVLALLAATVTVLGLRLRSEARTETARDQAVAASRDAARLLFSYDHSTLQDDFAKGLAVTTGDFREEYAKTTTDVVSRVATEYKAVVLADVVESAVVEASPDEVTTIVFLNQATTSTRVEGQQVDASRVRMTLVERDGRWLVSEVVAL